MKSNVIKLSLMLAATITLGIVFSLKDISHSIYFYNVYGHEKIQPVIINTIIISVYSFIFIFCLVWLNLVWKGKERKIRLFLASLTVTLIFYGLAAIFIGTDIPDEYYRLDEPEYQHDSGHNENLIFLGIKSFVMLCFVFIGGLIYNLYMKKIEVEKSLEKLRSESLQSRLTALSNQINPHFFFNALNSLHSLINEDKKESSLAYLSHLSNVFRYILQSETKSLVNLKDELDFLEKYKYMLSIKFGDRLSFDCQINESSYTYQLPVLSLLPVVENVVKHNEISSRNPLLIRIYLNDGELVITNKIKQKIDSVISDGTGLKNLNNRYEILVNREVRIIKTIDEFSVYLPLIPVKK
ncbi:MAG: histidine kinase [Ignavibacteriaceae bacterium]